MTNKRRIIIILSAIVILILLCITILTLINKKQIAEYLHVKSYFENKVLTNISDSQNLDISKPIVILFYGNYCKTCHEFMPAFKKLSKDYSKSYNFAALDIQDPANYAIVAGNVGGIPSLYIFDAEIGNKVHISLSAIRSYEQLKEELERYIRIRKFIDIETAKAEQQKLMQAYFDEIQNNSKKENGTAQ